MNRVRRVWVAAADVGKLTMRRTAIRAGMLALLVATRSEDALAMQSRAATPVEPLVVTDTTTIVITKPTVIAYLVIPKGAVDSLPDVAVLADDWNVAMSTLGDSLEANGIAFALVAESRLTVRSAGRRDVVFELDSKPAAGYVYARPGETPCLRRGPAEVDEVLAAARVLVNRRISPSARAHALCGARRR